VMCRRYCWLPTGALLFIALAGSSIAAQSGSPALVNRTPVHPPKRVLIVYSFDNDEAIYSDFDHELRQQIRLRARDRIEFYTEYLDLVRFPETSGHQDLVKLLKLKYSLQKPDLIVPVSYSALQFLMDECKDLFAGTPEVALFNQRRLGEVKQRLASEPAQDITGVTSVDDPSRTLDLALRLQPDTQRVAVIIGSSPLEQYWYDQLKHDLLPYAGRVEVMYLTGISLDELQKRVAQLSPHTVILSTFFFEDATGQFILPENLLDMVSRAAHVPIYSIYSSYIGHGAVGGRMTDSAKSGQRVADLAVAVLNGATAHSLPIVSDDAAQDMVDWRQLQKWGINERLLPPSTVELFREPSVWERYRFQIVAISALCLVESLLLVALILNVRRRKQAERAVLHEKTLADAVIEGLPGVFVLQDRIGKTLRWNKNSEALARYPLHQALAPDNIADEDRAALLKAREAVFEHGSAQVEAGFLLKGGKTAPYYFSGVKVDLEGQPYMAAIGIDLSEKKKAEAAVQRSEEEMRSLVENAPYGIGTISVIENRFLHANPAMVKLLGYGSEAEMRNLVVSRELYADGDSQLPRAQAVRAGFFSAVELNWRRKDGKAVIVRASGRRIRTNQGDLIEIIAEDVTERRSLEEQLRQAQKLEALGKLSGSVAHDFNNLLSVIIGYSELLTANSQLEGPMKAQIETIKRAGERAVSLTSQLLAFSRRQMLQTSVLNLNSLVRETQKMLQRLMGEDVEQAIILDPALWKTKADPGQMIQVLMNLAINSRDAMPTGGKLTIETANVTFSNATTIHGVNVPAGNYVRLSVTDTGTGMDTATLAHIFEPFFTTKEAGKGTGLGLATTYGIVKQSGGYVFADSELGKGSTFTIYLPQFNRTAAEPAPPKTPVTDRQKILQGAHTLLVAEDEAAFRDLLREGLQARGYQILMAANGTDALRVADEYGGPIDLLITDVIMPQMSGPDLARTLRAARDIPVLYMSGYTDDKLRDMSVAEEVALIRKPFYIDDLVHRINEILGRQSQEERQNAPSVSKP